ncbi:MAG: HutD family protein [Aquabacterium sp.]
MSPNIITIDQVASTPWLNGGGSTRELVTWPAPDDWSLRISVAEISRDGPFSAYPGVQRWFAVLDGAGVRLRLPDRMVKLTPDNPPLEFDGAATPGCALLEGPTRDLNLMLKADRAEGRMSVVQPGIAHVEASRLRAVFTCDDARLQIDGEPAITLPAMSLAWTPQGARQSWKLTNKRGRVRAFWIDAQPLP